MSHTFFIKWPFFWLIKLLGYTNNAYLAVTVITVLLTIASLVVVLYLIERRFVVFGTICLALASVLLLIPAQPYAGAILPVNMAMLATRNLEYVLYIASLVLIIKTPSLRKWQFWVGTVLLALLAAGDKLFLSISLGGAMIALVLYSLRRRWSLVTLSSIWQCGNTPSGHLSVRAGLLQRLHRSE